MPSVASIPGIRGGAPNVDDTEPPQSPEPSEPSATSPSHDDMQARLSALERVLGPVRRPGEAVRAGTEAWRSVSDRVVTPAWDRVTGIESRVQVMSALAVAIVLTLLLPARVANHPRWLLPGLATILFVIVLLVNPTKSPERAKQLRPLTFSLLAVMSLGNAASAGRLIVDLVNSEGIKSADTLLLTGAAIWVTNMIIFAVWYWEFDRGGPGARATMTKQYPDFVFPQMTDPTNSDPEWEPYFIDYLYLSFTNATAFSPTDVMPYARWAKVTMMAQSAVSLIVVVLVVARAVNVLKS
jgi:uncharacterized membrane protein